MCLIIIDARCRFYLSFFNRMKTPQVSANIYKTRLMVWLFTSAGIMPAFILTSTEPKSFNVICWKVLVGRASSVLHLLKGSIEPSASLPQDHQATIASAFLEALQFISPSRSDRLLWASCKRSRMLGESLLQIYVNLPRAKTVERLLVVSKRIIATCTCVDICIWQ